MTRRLVLLLVLAVLVAAGAAAVVWWPTLQGHVLGLWPFPPEVRARRAMAAIDAQDAATLSALVRGADHANLAAADGETLLLHAIRARNVPAVGLLLARGADPERAGNGQPSPLARAAELHLHEVIGMLTARGARVREIPGRPLLVALPALPPDELRTLLAAGANPYAASAQGESAFRAAAGAESPDRLRIILASPLPPDPDAGREALGAAVAAGRLENVKLLLAAGADPRAGDGRLLLAATVQGGLEVVRLLLEAGVDPDAHPADAEAPIVAAAGRGDVEVVKALLSRPGKRPAAAAALRAAVGGGRGEVVAALHAAGTPMPEEAQERQEAEHLLSRGTLGPNPPFKTLHRPLPAAWDGPLLVGTTLLERCTVAEGGAARAARWTAVDLPVSSLGRAEGDEVQALLSGGKAVRARLGKVSCLAGPCGRGWYEVALQGAAAREVVAVAPPGFLPARARVSALRMSAGRCASPAPGAPVEGKWRRTCALYRGPGKLAVEVLEYAAAAGAAPGAVHVRLLGPRPGPWLDLGDKGGLTPRLAIVAPGAPARIVLSRPGGASSAGLACVGRERPGNGLELGRCFAAGGRTCE